MIFWRMLQHCFASRDFVTSLIPVILATLIAYLAGFPASVVALFGLAGLVIYRAVVYAIAGIGLIWIAHDFGVSGSDFVHMMNFAESEGYPPEVAYAEWSDMTPDELQAYVLEAREYAQ